ncbi:DUF1010 domain-containing protein [Escherichia coli]
MLCLPRWRSVFSRLAARRQIQVLSVWLLVLNISVKPTRILRSAYLAR